METILDSDDWQLTGYMPDVFQLNIAKKARGETVMLCECISALRAAVPGGVHQSLLNFGIIKNPYYSTQNLECEWVENRCWVYSKTIKVQNYSNAKSYLLQFDGLNHIAEIYLNGQLIGAHSNVNTPCVINVTKFIAEENILEVALLPVPRERGQMGKASLVNYQCQRFGYGWDFGTRLVGIGIFKSVKLVEYSKTRLENFTYFTSVKNLQGSLVLDGFVRSLSALEITIKYKDVIKRFEIPLKGKFNTAVDLPCVELWYPNGYGSSPLYEVILKLFCGGIQEDEKRFFVGFANVKYELNDGAKDDSIPYTINVNGKKIWIKGVCYVNLDHILGAVKTNTYDYYFKQMKNMNINLVRLWGGGVLERDEFFERCDQNGIMVWQDFFQSGSGLDYFPSLNPVFVNELLLSAQYTVKKLKGHVSTVIFNGGNELKGYDQKPVTCENSNIKALKKIVKKYGRGIIFHPSSASGANFNFNKSGDSVNGNIHGEWTYLGDKHYEYFNSGNWQYHGEFGANGASCLSTWEKLLPQKSILEFYNQTGIEYLNRNVSYWGTYKSDKELFGEFKDVNTYINASQFIQAIAVRYGIERNRARAFECSGNNIWQLDEPWPNYNCSTLIDYYKNPKLVTKFVKNAYKQLIICAKFNKIVYEVGERFKADIQVSNLNGDYYTSAVAEIWSGGKKIFTSVSKSLPKSSAFIRDIFSVDEQVSNEFAKVFFLRLKLYENDVIVDENTYVFSREIQAPFAELLQISSKLNIECDVEGNITLTNLGDNLSLYNHIFSSSPSEYCGDNYITIYPSESASVNIGSAKNLTITDFANSYVTNLR